MRDLVCSIRRIGALAVGAAILSALPAPAEGAPLVHVKWEGLSMVAGRTVSIAMPGGGIVTGKAVGVESDALVVRVTKTTDPKGWPKGERRVPRETLRVFEMRSKGKTFQVLGTVVGAAAGFAGGASAWWNMTPFFAKTSGNGDAAFFGILAGGAVLGYLAGSAADARWTTVEVLP